MKIEPFCTVDVLPFLQLAASENWIAESWEFDFLLSSFPKGCFKARDDNGEAAGFVTAIRHEQSGWIGNLIVAEKYRGRGIGENLFRGAMRSLWLAGVRTIWLTASTEGKSLYKKCGFSSIDTIIRWRGSGRQGSIGHDPQVFNNSLTGIVADIDCQAWGDRRDALLAVTAGRGRVISDDGGFAVIQPCGDSRQIGPFLARERGVAEQLLAEAQRTVGSKTELYLDAPASNRAALRLFNRRRMRIVGSSELMYAGAKPDYRPELIYGLATMGSCG